MNDKLGSPLPVYLIHWNAPEWVKSSTDSILSSDIPVKVTVIDNGPLQASKDLDLAEVVRLIPTGGNLGYAGGANVALRDWLSGSSDWCVIGAHDLHVETSDLRRMLEAGKKTKHYGILGPGTAEYEGMRYWSGNYKGESEGIEERSSMSGTCLLLRKKCIREIGLFDPQFQSYCEDDELCSRAQRFGWKVGKVPGTFAHGLGTQASNRDYLVRRNRVLLEMKRSGKRTAGLRVLILYAKIMTLASMKLVVDKSNRANHRATVAWTWHSIRYGVPLLWKRMVPPPTAP